MSSRTQWRRARLAVLGLALAGVGAWAAHVRHGERRPVDWSKPHVVVLCPIVSARASLASVQPSLDAAPRALDAWFAQQHEWWTGEPGEPVDVRLGEVQRAGESPPRLPETTDSFVERWRRTRAFLKWFASRGCPRPAGSDSTLLFVYVYPKDEQSYWEGRHSVGTTRGRRGMVFASDDPEHWGNALAVMAHETLHSVGALEHRDADGTIAFPSGYADPSRTPRLPQEKAEVMALGVPVGPSPDDEVLVTSLDDVVLGLWTAKEIGWKR